MKYVYCFLQFPSDVASDLHYTCAGIQPWFILCLWKPPLERCIFGLIPVGAECHSGFKHIHCVQTLTLFTNPFPWFQGWWASLFTKKNPNSCKCLPLPREWFSRDYKRIKVAEHPQTSAISSTAVCSFHATSPDTIEQEKTWAKMFVALK